MGRYEVKDADKLIDSFQRIARKILQSAFIRAYEGCGMMDIFADRHSVEYS